MYKRTRDYLRTHGYTEFEGSKIDIGLPGPSSDEYSLFRPYLKSARAHVKAWKERKRIPVEEKCILEIGLEDLKNLWEKQGGRCPYTGWNLEHVVAPNSKARKWYPQNPRKASLDRIDPEKGYRVGNIQFVSMAAQFAKNSWSEEILLEFCQAVSQHRNLTY